MLQFVWAAAEKFEAYSLSSQLMTPCHSELNDLCDLFYIIWIPSHKDTTHKPQGHNQRREFISTSVCDLRETKDLLRAESRLYAWNIDPLKIRSRKWTKLAVRTVAVVQKKKKLLHLFGFPVGAGADL